MVRSALWAFISLLVVPATAVRAEHCTDIVHDIMFCDETPVRLAPLAGVTWRVIFDLHGQDTVTLISIEPVDNMRFARDIPRDRAATFLRQIHRIQSNFWRLGHKSKDKSVSQVERHNGWPVVFTEFSPKSSWFRKTEGAHWHYTTAIICNTGLLIEQVEGDARTPADMSAIAERILAMARAATPHSATSKECLSDV